MRHPFLDALYDPKADNQLLVKDPITYYDFEFEQYTINNDIIRELLVDEIIMSNNESAAETIKGLRTKFPNGVLERIYEKQETEK